MSLIPAFSLFIYLRIKGIENSPELKMWATGAQVILHFNDREEAHMMTLKYRNITRLSREHDVEKVAWLEKSTCFVIFLLLFC